MKAKPQASLDAILAELRALREEVKAAGKRALPVSEAAPYIGLAARTILKELASGTFPVKPRRYGGKILFRREDLDRFLDNLPEYKPQARKRKAVVGE